MKDKNQKLDYFSENLAFPEIHVNSHKPSEDDNTEEPENGGEVVYDNLAIPEIKIKKHDKKIKNGG